MVVMYGFLIGFPDAPRRCIAVLLCSRRLSLFYSILFYLELFGFHVSLCDCLLQQTSNSSTICLSLTSCYCSFLPFSSAHHDLHGSLQSVVPSEASQPHTLIPHTRLSTVNFQNEIQKFKLGLLYVKHAQNSLSLEKDFKKKSSSR